MKKIFLFAAATAVALSSCSKNEVTTTSADNNAIGFGLYTGVSTKSTVVDDTAIQSSGFGVFGYYTDDTAWTGSDESANFMYNQEVTHDGSWSYTPVKYWPNENTDYISFFAYAPYIDGTDVKYATLSTASEGGTPTVTFDYSGEFDMSKTTDFVAGNAIDKTQDDGDVEFTLSHELTRVALSVALAADLAETSLSTVVVKNIEFSGAKVYDKGTYTFGNTDGGIGSWALSISGDDATFEMITYMENYNSSSVSLGAGETKYTTSGVLLTTTSAETLGTGGYVFALPAYLSTETTFAANDVVLTIVYDVVTADAALANGSYSAIENTKSFSLTSSEASTLVQGKAYSYEFTISLTDVTLSATVSGDWSAADDDELTVTADDSTESNS